MTVPFQMRFVELAAERSPLCVGIDPSAEILEAWGLADDAPGLRAFCERMVDCCAPRQTCALPVVRFRGNSILVGAPASRCFQ